MTMAASCTMGQTGLWLFPSICCEFSIKLRAAQRSMVSLQWYHSMRNTRKPLDRLSFLITSYLCSTSIMVVLVSLQSHNRFKVSYAEIYRFILDKCQNELKSNRCGLGFPHPRDCSKCVCPSGYEGPRCDQKVTYRDVVMRNSFTALCVL